MCDGPSIKGGPSPDIRVLSHQPQQFANPTHQHYITKQHSKYRRKTITNLITFRNHDYNRYYTFLFLSFGACLILLTADSSSTHAVFDWARHRGAMPEFRAIYDALEKWEEDEGGRGREWICGFSHVLDSNRCHVTLHANRALSDEKMYWLNYLADGKFTVSLRLW